MAPFDRIVQSASENLYGDERLRSNFDDDEAKVVLSWAEAWLEGRINAAKSDSEAKGIAQTELTRVRQVVVAINNWVKRPGALRLSDAVAAIEPAISGGRPFKRSQVIAMLVVLTGAAWSPSTDKAPGAKSA